MLSQSRAFFSWILLVISLLLGTLAKADAKEIKINNKVPICTAEQETEDSDLTPAENKIQAPQKTDPSKQDQDFTAQDTEPCQNRESLEFTEITDETVGGSEAPEPSSDKDFEPSANPIDPYSNDGSIPDDSTLSQPSTTNQDSHDFNFSIQFGGTSSGNGESFPEPEIPSPIEPEPSEAEPSKTSPFSEGNFEQPTQLPPKPSKPKEKRGHKSKHHKSKKLHHNNEEGKRDQKKQSSQKSKTPWTQQTQKDHKTTRKIKPHTRRSLLKHLRNSKTWGPSHPRKLPLIHREGIIQKPHHRRYNLKFRPQLRQHVTPRQTLRPSAPRLHRMHRRTR